MVLLDVMNIRKLSLYIETSLFGFYYDENIINKEKRNAVRKLFTQIESGYFKDAFVSSVTLIELARAPETIKDKLLPLISRYKMKEIETNIGQVDALTKRYAKDMPIFRRWENDARHISIATVAGIDVLVTLNCEHIVNEQTIRKVRLVNIEEGYAKELDIRRPEEVIFYEN